MQLQVALWNPNISKVRLKNPFKPSIAISSTPISSCLMVSLIITAWTDKQNIIPQGQIDKKSRQAYSYVKSKKNFLK
jgi:hypothetical protein